MDGEADVRSSSAERTGGVSLWGCGESRLSGSCRSLSSALAMGGEQHRLRVRAIVHRVWDFSMI